MLGMVTAQSIYTSHNPIIPDYKKSVQEIYLEACSWMIQDLQSLRVLDLCDSPSTNKLTNLPSWVPDLSKGPRKCARFLNRDHLPDDEGNMLLKFDPQWSTTVDGPILTTNAFIFDTISELRFPFTSERHLRDTFLLFRDLALDQIPYPTGGSRIEALWRILIGNTVSIGKSNAGEGDVRGGKPQRAASSLNIHFMNFMAKGIFDELGLPAKLTGQEADLRDLKVSDAYFHLEDWFPAEVRDNVSILALMERQPLIKLLYESVAQGDYMQYSIQYATKAWLCEGDQGRQFMYTAKGYMGVGPPCPAVTRRGDGRMIIKKNTCVEVGDAVAILGGSDKVWILRGGMDSCYRIVGQAYIYGLSEGTCFHENKLPRMEKLKII